MVEQKPAFATLWLRVASIVGTAIFSIVFVVPFVKGQRSWLIWVGLGACTIALIAEIGLLFQERRTR